MKFYSRFFQLSFFFKFSRIFNRVFLFPFLKLLQGGGRQHFSDIQPKVFPTLLFFSCSFLNSSVLFPFPQVIQGGRRWHFSKIKLDVFSHSFLNSSVFVPLSPGTSRRRTSTFFFGNSTRDFSHSFIFCLLFSQLFFILSLGTSRRRTLTPWQTPCASTPTARRR